LRMMGMNLQGINLFLFVSSRSAVMSIVRNTNHILSPWNCLLWKPLPWPKLEV
jgi:hypothetical protein